MAGIRTELPPSARAERVGASDRVMAYTMAQKIPSASSRSPRLTTSRMTGIGRGTTSPSRPPEATNWAIVSARRST